MNWAAFLSEREANYSGGQTRVSRRRVSEFDPRGDVAQISGSMLSGGRFIDGTGYARVYAESICHLRGTRFVLVELGVLLGVGLAVWCDVFPEARVIGLDVDIERMDAAALRERGAFEQSSPEAYFLDELAPGAPQMLAGILRGERIGVMIDDALHDDASILRAMAAFLPFMAERFVYFIEDNDTVAAAIRRQYPGFTVKRHGSLTVVTND